MRAGLEKSISSLILQNQRKDVEFIIVDGLSIDGSDKVITKYGAYIDKILIEKDKGIFDAMNKGINLASGEYIYFLNSGDEFASNDVIRLVIKELENSKTDYQIYSGNVKVFRLGNSLGVLDLDPWIVHQSAFVKSSLMREFLFDPEYRIFGDLDLWTRLSVKNRYDFYKMDIDIANMELDGVGSDPEFTFKRLKDKCYYARKHKKYLNFIGSAVSEIIGYFVYIVFGRVFYFKKFSKNMQKIKVLIKNI
jgi:glycosyltransferase involved in cell wall biosynthesis